MKKIAMIIIPGLTLLACSNENEAESRFAGLTRNEKGHEHTYRCPMHPEITGKEGESCPNCGMKLKHSDDATSTSGSYFMEFSSIPSVIAPNQEVTLSLIPKKEDYPAEQVALETEHEKKIHLILVSDDLSWFDHIHPEYASDGSYRVNAKFPASGKYIAFADYKPSGAGHFVDKLDISVQGTAPAPTVFSTQKLTGNSGNYTFTLTPDGGKLTSGMGVHIQGIIKKDGKEIDANTLDNYLGAKAHIVVISRMEKEYLHVHPAVANGQFDIQTTFDKPGLYRCWVQFIAEGKLHTIDFTMNVAQGPAQEKTSASSSDHHSSHSH